jgi:hypothetical protein
MGIVRTRPKEREAANGKTRVYKVYVHSVYAVSLEIGEPTRGQNVGAVGRIPALSGDLKLSQDSVAQTPIARNFSNRLRTKVSRPFFFAVIASSSVR